MYDFQNEELGNKKLYEFLATSYDISSLANKIKSDEQVFSSFFNLKKLVGKSNEIRA